MENKVEGFSSDELDLRQYETVYLDDRVFKVGELARWLLLVEAFDFISKAEEDRDEEVDDDKIVMSARRHKAITKYIDERYWAMAADILKDSSIKKGG